MKGVDPVVLPELWDSFFLAGKQSPGQCKFGGLPKRDVGWDVQVAKGTTGGNTIKNNEKPVEFDVELYLWKDENSDHFALWDEFKDLLDTPIKPNAPKALDIFHPQLDGLNIRSVVPKTKAEYQPDGKGGGTVKWKFLEYRPVKKAPAQGPNGSKNDANAKKKNTDPNADLKKQVAELTKKFQEAG